ncbi:alpha/beta fold hydrolase [Parasphingorhabdus halotolerans]|uniref:Alpha/beta hydrolase n=1 Tax=Parasphingorhabdus halotolerans TaxID=2725558 RepID=A0A6H2DPL4_9SPHN|nr:alpha/beta hydrolase [Parasphingorhabdus halotolerans]QJB69923.1 alpha/beta hydrolase [Parasphingorhabdus halotolerans]
MLKNTNVHEPLMKKSTVKTRFGTMSYLDCGTGFPAVMIHGLGQSSYFWRHQIDSFYPRRRCLAVDLMAHGDTEANPDQDVSFREQAQMILEALTEIGIEKFDLLLNDSGGAVGQIMAVKAPDRVRSMVITNCDVHDNWPPEALGEIRDAARAGLLADQFGLMIGSPEVFYADGGIGPMVYENAKAMTTRESIDANMVPIVSSAERKAAFNRYAGLQDHQQLVVIENDLRKLRIPSLIVWGTNDVFFPVQWAYWLKDALIEARDVIEIGGAKLFFPEERPEELNNVALRFWESLV